MVYNLYNGYNWYKGYKGYKQQPQPQPQPHHHQQWRRPSAASTNGGRPLRGRPPLWNPLLVMVRLWLWLWLLLIPLTPLIPIVPLIPINPKFHPYSPPSGGSFTHPSGVFQGHRPITRGCGMEWSVLWPVATALRARSVASLKRFS